MKLFPISILCLASLGCAAALSAQDRAPLASLVSRDCVTASSAQIGEWLASIDHTMYSRAENRASFLVTATGNVLGRPAAILDENDVVAVYVLADPSVFPHLQVARSSPTRDVSQLVLLGGGVGVGGVVGSVSRSAAAAPCRIEEYDLTDFAPGEAKVRLTAVADDGTRVSNEIAFVVDKLYAGALSFGPALSAVPDRDYTLSEQGADTIITYSRNSSSQLRYAVFYTPYLWAEHDIMKPGGGDTRWYAHVNPSLGVVVTDISHNALAGATVDLKNSLFLTFGGHVARVRELDSRYNPEDKFHGPAASLPVQERWKAKPFCSVAVDLRAAAQLIAGAVSAAATKS